MSEVPIPKRAVLLAGGLGTRLQPYTVVLPKPLMPIGEYPILEVIVRQLVRHGFEHITMAVNHQANIIKAFFGDGSKWNVQIDYSLETEPLGTIAPLMLVPDLPEHFLLMNGDILTDLDFSAFWAEHVHNRRLFTVGATCRRQIADYGILHTNGSQQLIGFEEKPATDYMVSMGIYLVGKPALSFIPEGKKYGFDDLMHAMLRTSTPVHVHVHRGYWADIGRPDDYMQAIRDFDSLRDSFLFG